MRGVPVVGTPLFALAAALVVANVVIGSYVDAAILIAVAIWRGRRGDDRS